jgi:chemotaxis protein MotB
MAEESTEHFFTSFTDLLVGVIFLFMLMLMVFALNLKNAEIQKPVIITEEIRANILREIAKRMQAEQAPVTLDLQNGILRLPEDFLFDSGQWQLNPKGQQLVATLATVLGSVLPCATQSNLPCQWIPQPIPLDSLLIEGHTDNRPFNGAGGLTNWELSAFRAITVYKALVAANPQLETTLFNTSHQPILGVSAYADRRPVDSTAPRPNRRIDMRFNMHAINPALLNAVRHEP